MPRACPGQFPLPFQAPAQYRPQRNFRPPSALQRLTSPSRPGDSALATTGTTDALHPRATACLLRPVCATGGPRVTGAIAIALSIRDGRVAARVTPPPPLALARLLHGQTPEAVAAMIPRLFNLCGAAQGFAARRALGLPTTPAAPRHEILRDHLVKLGLHWPRLLGLPPRALPPGWQAGGAAVAGWIWDGPPPATLEAALAQPGGIGPLLAALAARFAPGEAVADLPPLSDPMSLSAQENSPAGRVAGAALMAQAAARFGRGPLWRALGRGLDLAALATAPLPLDHLPGGGVAVAASRGTFALALRCEGGRVTDLTRVTPTDHLLAPGGAIAASLSALPAGKIALAGLVVEILDPCLPVAITPAEGGADA